MATRRPARAVSAPRDVIETLIADRSEASWLDLGPAQLVPGGPWFEPVVASPPLEVELLEERGADVRVGVRLPVVRFALWVRRDRLLAVVTRESRVAAWKGYVAPPSQASTSVTLREGARVRLLARAGGWAHVRYQGAFEVEGWVPAGALSPRGPAGRGMAPRRHPGGTPLLLLRGTAVLDERRFGARALAVLDQGDLVELVRELEGGWLEVGYRDDELELRGYASRQVPPAHVHRERQAELAPGPELVTNLTVPSGTCLFAHHEPVGMVTADTPARVEPSPRVGWYDVTLDTPWGAMPFEARGALESALQPCDRGP